MGNGDPGSESMSEAQIPLILARAALDNAAASNDGDPRSVNGLMRLMPP